MSSIGNIAAVVLHPHPGMGGDRSHPLVVAIADRLRVAGVTAVRPDLDDPDPAAAAPTLRTIADDLVEEADADRLVLVGYSWGSVVSALTQAPALTARILIAPPVGMIDLGGDDGVPTLVLVPADDQFGGPDAVHAAFGARDSVEIEVVDGADHFLVGAVDRVADRAVDWIVDRLA